MSKKEILIELLKQSLGERLTKLEKNEKEAEASLKLISTTFDGFSKKISALVKLREEKVLKEKSEEIKKHQNKPVDNPKSKKREMPPAKIIKKQSVAINNINTKKNVNEKISDKKPNLAKTKSSANLNNKKPVERVRGKSIGRLNTEVSRNTIAINPTGNNIKKKIIGGNKKEKDNFLNEAPRRNTIGGNMVKRPMRTSKSMGRLANKPSLKKNPNKKKEEEMQKMVNNIKIEDKDLTAELYNEEEVKEEIKEEIIPPTLMSCYTKGILEKSILQFLTKNEQIILFSCNKSLSKLTINILKDAISQYKQDYDILIGETIDDKIKGLEEKYSKEELNEPLKKFELSRGTLKAIGLLDDEIYMRIFIRPVQEKILKEISTIYRIFCQFLGFNDIVEIKNDKLFWEKFSKYVLDNKGEKLSKFCSETSKKFIFDDKNILKVKSLAKDLNEKLKPKYWTNICGTTGFFVFMIKDAVEYSGVLEDKKTQPSRIKENYLYVKGLFEKLDKYVNFLEGLN